MEGELILRPFALGYVIAGLVGMTTAGSACAQTALPPPPYATQAYATPYQPAPQAAQTLAGGPQRYDRYGGGMAHPVVSMNAAYAPPIGPRLSWVGKTDGAAPAQAYANASTGASNPAVPAGWTLVPTAQAPLRQAVAPHAYAQPSPAQRTPYPSLTTTPAAPMQAATAQMTQASPSPSASTTGRAQSNEGGPRLYSLHRDYGMEPDPIPLAPQFFSATADMTQPETPEPLRQVKSANGASRVVANDATGGGQ
jgi:hypothetical protein